MKFNICSIEIHEFQRIRACLSLDFGQYLDSVSIELLLDRIVVEVGLSTGANRVLCGEDFSKSGDLYLCPVNFDFDGGEDVYLRYTVYLGDENLLEGKFLIIENWRVLSDRSLYLFENDLWDLERINKSDFLPVVMPLEYVWGDGSVLGKIKILNNDYSLGPVFIRAYRTDLDEFESIVKNVVSSGDEDNTFVSFNDECVRFATYGIWSYKGFATLKSKNKAFLSSFLSEFSRDVEEFRNFTNEFFIKKYWNIWTNKVSQEFMNKIKQDSRFGLFLKMKNSINQLSEFSGGFKELEYVIKWVEFETCTSESLVYFINFCDFIVYYIEQILNSYPSFESFDFLVNGTIDRSLEIE